MNEPTSTDNYVQIGDKVINRTVDASVTTDDVQLSDRVFVFKKNDDGSIKTVVNTTIQYVVDAFGADAVATKNEVVTLKNDVITLKEQTSTYASDAESSKDTAKLWAISESIVESEDYSAKYYAEKAETLSKVPCYFRKQTYAVSASAGDTSITIPSEAQYRSGADILFIHNKGVYLKEGTDYTKTDTGITLTNALEVATTIEIDILRAVSTDSQSYDLLKGDKGDKGEDGSFSKSQLLDMIYPVGAIYTSLENVSPASTLGGTWTPITNTFLYAQGSKTVGETGGEETHKLVEKEVPSHSHTRGSMNITGRFGATAGYFNEGLPDGKVFYSSGSLGSCNGNDSRGIIYFDASKNWTGSTSEAGSGKAFSIMNPYRAVYIWKRVKPTA